jgi:diacylglycerol kinase (ATP)
MAPLLQETVPMHITLVYNPNAGDGLDGRELTALLEGAGHDVRTVPRKGNWHRKLVKPTDLVVAVGGDGTITEVAVALAGTEVPMAILPMGTANNVGKTLGLLGDARPVIESWNGAEPEPFDLGTASGPWQESLFVESFGAGAVASLITARDDIDASSLLLGRVTDRSLHRLGVLLDEEPMRHWSVSIDGAQHDGEYVAVEILNIRFVGPNLPLAPDADPRDGMLDVVLIGREECKALRDYLSGRLTLAAAALPGLPVLRGRDIRLDVPEGVRLHVDDGPWPDDKALPNPAHLTVAVRPGALRVMPGAAA